MTGVTCLRCRRLELRGCACDYIARELTADKGATRVAAVMARRRLPVVDGLRTFHFSGCPCPRCFDLRWQSWELDRIPSAPRRESWSELSRFDASDSEAANV